MKVTNHYLKYKIKTVNILKPVPIHWIRMNTRKFMKILIQTEVVNVRLPKFKIEKTVEFVNVLDDLGVSQV